MSTTSIAGSRPLEFGQYTVRLLVGTRRRLFSNIATLSDTDERQEDSRIPNVTARAIRNTAKNRAEYHLAKVFFFRTPGGYLSFFFPTPPHAPKHAYIRCFFLGTSLVADLRQRALRMVRLHQRSKICVTRNMSNACAPGIDHVDFAM
jgi:hypothetical protein